MNNVVHVSHLSRCFGATKALNDVSFSLPSTGLIGILGASGSGKSTLLNALSGIDVGYQGEVKILGKRQRRMNEAKRRAFRLSRIGYVFQNFNLLDLETAMMNVLFPMDALYGGKTEEKKKKAFDLLSFFGMEKKAKQKVNTLSGGEKQRVALARALANDPKILLCDEPTGALDEAKAEETFALLRRIALERLVLVVSHDRERLLRHADRVIYLRDGKVEKDETLTSPRAESAPKSFLLRQVRPRPKVSWRYLFLHAFHLMKAKKARTFIAEAAIATGLAGLGLSVYVSTSIGDELNAAFASLVPPSAVVMSPRGGGESPLGSIYGASFEECEYAVEEYGDMVRDYGSDLHLDYEAWFKDRNDFTYQSGVEQMRLPGFSLRHVNDFQWFDTLESPMCYPRTPANTRVDQLVLGLPYETMFQTCLNLHILRNYQALGDHIDAHGFELVLHLANEEYGFEDEELFSVVAVVESERPTIYHLDHRWNRKILLDQLRFRSSLSEELPTPQYVFEIPYLHLEAPISEFLRFARRDENLQHLLFERADASYVPTAAEEDGTCFLPRLYLYGADKTGVGYRALDECMTLCPEIAGREPAASGSFCAEAGSLAMGFAGKFFLCGSRSSAEEAIDFFSDLPIEAANLPAALPAQCLDGSIFAAGSGGLRLSADLSSLPESLRPQSSEECALSEELYEAWGRPKEVFVAAEIGAEEVGDSYVRRFRLASLKVTASIPAAYDTLFVGDDWTVDFFLEALGMSSFYLEPYGAVFSLKEGTKAAEVVERLSKAFPDYSFSNPAEEVAASIASTLRYVGVILRAFSLLSLAMSALLFLIVMTISVSESAGEARMLSVLGLSRKDVLRAYFAEAISLGSIAVISSSCMTIFAELFTKGFIAASFHAKPSHGLPLMPLGVVLGAGILFTLIVMLGISAHHLRKM